MAAKHFSKSSLVGYNYIYVTTNVAYDWTCTFYSMHMAVLFTISLLLQELNVD